MLLFHQLCFRKSQHRIETYCAKLRMLKELIIGFVNNGAVDQHVLQFQLPRGQCIKCKQCCLITVANNKKNLYSKFCSLFYVMPSSGKLND